MLVVVVEEAGDVETERGVWEVGGTAEGKKEGEGVADSAAIGESMMRLFQLEPLLGGPPNSQGELYPQNF